MYYCVSDRFCSFHVPSGRQKRWQKCVLLCKRLILQLPSALCSSKTLAKVCIIVSTADFAASECHLVVKNARNMLYYCFSANAKPYDFNPKPYDFDAEPYDFDAKPHDFDAKPYDFDTKPYGFDAKLHDFDAKPHDFYAKQYNFDTKPYELEAKLYDFDAKPYDFEAKFRRHTIRF